ncbi:prenyltransferase/squalene oxidase repeat-containing protein [Gandjariella thermophila]|uniref:Squalene cyclase C-terminal domain-containing protein n=1 Tax=Gandjariella thermophila TaxID=1931992 RepID=A0A4D4J8N6_9PSEU|nr:prenyltransferase/squalene oxidase repeat-containing protein [Gandjariella thermophila]GDY31592.1 hypothetical protein GTS_32250 [Gandjariella thermophila]
MGLTDHHSTDTANAVAALLADMCADPHGEVSPSVYETARLVTLAPWLRGHADRLRFLLAGQRGDGGWGGPDGYDLVPTLSATEALLTSLRRPPDAGVDRGTLITAVDRGLRWLVRRLAGRPSIPDTVAAEILVPALVAAVNAHLDRLASDPLPGLDSWSGGARLDLPSDVDADLVCRLGRAVRTGGTLPTTLHHSLEALGGAARGAPGVVPTGGALGCSPAATAAWLGGRPVAADHPSLRYLEHVQGRHGGPVPGVSPITTFERAWVLAAAATAGIPVAVPPVLLDDLSAAFGGLGVPSGPGLPADADDTAAALYVLAHFGTRQPVDPLWAYRAAGGHFHCFPAERTPSTSTNAHVLRAIGEDARRHPAAAPRCRPAISSVVEWLVERQERDGSWWDKWHASPYYATARCATVLARHGGTVGAAAARAAVRWVLASQHPDGSWGRWAGTFEETAYAVQTLLLAGARVPDDTVARAAARGCAVLLRWPRGEAHPPLWHDKDLYTPVRVVRAEGAAALQLALGDPRVAGLLHGGEAPRDRLAAAGSR